MSATRIAECLGEEIEKADAKFGPFRSSHEGLGVLIEEVSELTATIRLNDCFGIIREAIQVAAVACRIAESMTLQTTHDRSGCS